MVINASCSCGKKYHLSNDKAGKNVRCPSCGGIFTVPSLLSPLDDNPPLLAEDLSLQIPPDLGRPSVPQPTPPAVAQQPKGLSKGIGVLLKDPIAGQSDAIAAMGNGNAVGMGLLFMAIYISSTYLSGLRVAYLTFAPWSGPGMATDMNLEAHLKFILMAAIPCAAILLGVIAMRAVFTGGLAVAADILTSGVIVLPWAMASLSFCVLGPHNIELTAILAIFAVIISVLLFNASLVYVHKIKTSRAMWLTPSLVLLVAYLCKVIFSAMFMPT